MFLEVKITLLTQKRLGKIFVHISIRFDMYPGKKSLFKSYVQQGKNYSFVDIVFLGLIVSERKDNGARKGHFETQTSFVAAPILLLFFS